MTDTRVMPLKKMDSVTDRTIKAVRDLILNGHFQPGDRINEVELAASLEVSRARLREALKHCESEGLVKHVANYGRFVPEFGAADTSELYELREALEVMATRLVVERATAEDIRAMRALLQDTDSFLETVGDTHYPYDIDFHARIFELSRNKPLARSGQEVHWQLSLTLYRAACRPGRARLAYKEHLAILDAIEAGDLHAAGEAMRAHLHSSLDNVRSMNESNFPE